MKNDAGEDLKSASSAKLFILIVVSMLILCGAVYFVMLQRGDAGKASNNEVTDNNSSGKVEEGSVNEGSPGEIATDPVSGEQVIIDKAPYQYYFAGNRYYFKSEKNLLAFIDDPIKYSGAKLKLTIKVKTSPSPDEIITPTETIPENTDTPGEAMPDVTTTETPTDTPVETPAESIVETPFGADSPDSGTPEAPADPPAGNTGPPSSTGDPTAPPADQMKSENPPAAPMPEMTTPTKPAETEKPKMEIPSGAYSNRPKSSPSKKPQLKETPIAPPTEGVETL